MTADDIGPSWIEPASHTIMFSSHFNIIGVIEIYFHLLSYYLDPTPPMCY